MGGEQKGDVTEELPWGGSRLWGTREGEEEEDEEAFLCRQGSCQELVPRAGQCLLFSVTACFLLHNASGQPHPTDCPEARGGLSLGACGWAAGMSGPWPAPPRFPVQTAELLGGALSLGAGRGGTIVGKSRHSKT